MKHATGLVNLAALAILFCDAGHARAVLIAPADVRGIRSVNGGSPFLLQAGFLPIKIDSGLDDRTVAEFSVSGFSPGTITQATLDLDLTNLDQPTSGTINVFAFAGNGTVTPDLFNAGTFVNSLTTSASGLFQVDVTSAVQEAVDAGDQFIGFRLSALVGARFVTGPFAGLENPQLEVVAVVPEPSSLTLAGLSALGLLIYGWRRKCAIA